MLNSFRREPVQPSIYELNLNIQYYTLISTDAFPGAQLQRQGGRGRRRPFRSLHERTGRHGGGS